MELVKSESGNTSEAKFIEPRFNFVEEDPSRPSIFWKLQEYYCAIVNCEGKRIPPKLSEMTSLFNEEGDNGLTIRSAVFHHTVLFVFLIKKSAEP